MAMRLSLDELAGTGGVAPLVIAIVNGERRMRVPWSKALDAIFG